MVVTSKDNEMVRHLRRLSADAKARRKEGAFVIEGARLCGDAARSGVVIETALLTERARQRWPEQAAAVEAAAAHVFDMSEAVAASLSETDTAQGVCCLCRMPGGERSLDDMAEDLLFSFKNKKWLALEDVRDPGNVGTVIRTAEAMGIGGLILSAGCCDVFSPKVLRGSMGGVFRLPIYETASMPDALARLQRAGLCGYACVPDAAGALSVVEAPLGAGSVCVVGNEANGLTDAAIAACRHRLTIPMAGRAESLNAAVAAAIVLWELARRDH